MKMFLLPVTYMLVACNVLGHPTVYDQRQTGEINVQIDLKDLQVIALIDTEFLDDYTEYNYSYDYSDFTIKPPPHPAVSNTTHHPWHTWPTIPSSSTAKPNNTQENVTSSISPSPNDNSTFLSSSHLNPAISSTSTAMDSQDHLLNLDSKQLRLGQGRVKFCQVGFYRDDKGRCRKVQRRRFSFLPFAARVLPKRMETQSARSRK